MREPNPVTAAAQASGEPVFRQIGVGPWNETHPNDPRPDDPKSPNFDPRFDSELLDNGDRRNVLDKFRYWSVEAIKAELDKQGRHGFDVAVENWTHDFNIGSMVRTANAFAAHKVHIVGPHKWNRKGALMTELYQHVDHHPSIEDLVTSWKAEMKEEIAQAQAAEAKAEFRFDKAHYHEAAEDAKNSRIIALDIIPGAVPIETYRFPRRCLMLFGAEGPGLSQRALELADDVVYISQFGSVRSINAGAAAAVSMHCWISQNMR
ncbi:TrmH family RNA methyltransferase [Bifidobacterium sp. ESL0790]|uniref:TrmH family RNA methyltransferase n=1 Tax=Bifidobacterium sp. ESL0790 TaxID=2983233 RepID=UPI0023F8536D|nr:TrmH family RNA methyltransferase [Bifidobacterium sp. ESL0790]WEV72303.1 RNA methyltransferase [Bifidobacterium sp. ESL0790]